MTSIVTLTINPAVDVSTSVEEVVPTHKLRCAETRRDPGGGGVNVARVVGRLGGDVKAIYTVGGPMGRLLQRLVEGEGIANTTIEIADDTRESFTVREAGTGHEYRFVLPGPCMTRGEWQRCLEALEGLNPPPLFLVASGSLPRDVPEDFYACVARIAKGFGARFVLDTSGPPLAAALEEGVYLSKPNLRELSEIVDLKFEDREARLAAARDFLARGYAEVVALTLGHEGALLVTRDEAFAATVPEVTTVSSVGAGDSFVGGMVARLAADADLASAFRCGVATGTATLLTPGTELCHRPDVERLEPQVAIEMLALTSAVQS